jgi:hypothetical protein
MILIDGGTMMIVVDELGRQTTAERGCDQGTMIMQMEITIAMTRLIATEGKTGHPKVVGEERNVVGETSAVPGGVDIGVRHPLKSRHEFLLLRRGHEEPVL